MAPTCAVLYYLSIRIKKKHHSSTRFCLFTFSFLLALTPGFVIKAGHCSPTSRLLIFKKENCNEEDYDLFGGVFVTGRGFNRGGTSRRSSTAQFETNACARRSYH